MMNLMPQRIILDLHSSLGDNIQYQTMMLMLRTMFPQAQIHCVCNKTFSDLLPCVNANIKPDYFTLLHYIGLSDEKFSKKFLECVENGFGEEGLPADLIILADRRKDSIRLALKSSCAKVVTFSYFPSLWTPRLPFVSYIRRWKIHEIFHYQHLVRSLNPKRYDQVVKTVDLKQAQLTFPNTLLEQVKQELINIGWNTQSKLVIVNPLSATAERCGYNFKHVDWVKIAEFLAQKYPDLFFVISSYGQRDINNIGLHSPNLSLWLNNSGIAALACLVSFASLVLCPSTGTAHIADNLGVDICAAYPFYDSKRWIPNGMNQLSAKYDNKSWTPNNVSVLFLQKGWQSAQESYSSYLARFQCQCDEFIAKHIVV